MDLFTLYAFILTFLSETFNWTMYWHRKSCKVQQIVKPRNCCELESYILNHGETNIRNSDTQIIVEA